MTLGECRRSALRSLDSRRLFGGSVRAIAGVGDDLVGFDSGCGDGCVGVFPLGGQVVVESLTAVLHQRSEPRPQLPQLCIDVDRGDLRFGFDGLLQDAAELQRHESHTGSGRQGTHVSYLRLVDHDATCGYFAADSASMSAA